MRSKLEATILKCNKHNEYVRNTLFDCLDDRTLRQLRMVSKTLCNSIDRSAKQLFGKLYLTAPFPDNRYVDCLELVAPHCQDIVIRVRREQDTEQGSKHGSGASRQQSGLVSRAASPRNSARQRWHKVRQALASRPDTLVQTPNRPFIVEQTCSLINRPSTSSNSEGNSEQPSQVAVQDAWTDLLSRFTELRSLFIECNGDPAWHGQTDLERTLVILRAALESAGLQKLHNVRLSPIHASGIIHLRWSGFGAFGSAPASAYPLWQNVHTLDLQIQSPFASRYNSTESQRRMFKAILHDYLGSFAPTLKRLRFMWLDGEGPSPMTLDLEEDLRRQRRAIVWTAMEEFWLGNIEFPHRTIRSLPERTPNAWKLRTLRVTHTASKDSFEDPSAWVDAMLRQQSPDRTRASSSLYSRE